ncbi:Ubiquitin-related modifier 1 [Acropora cervicornis]|uniref:Ubiquitin-related modifier 1 n=1 Tax=Acropora cervicornis TaxID=6130 RepID=A0AAD9QR56_ACRCE|nr:Ubiquitin-related modifier 1 [Acropora cervicornis]
MAENGLKISVHFSGGAELLFNKVKEHEVVLPNNANPWNIKRLLVWIRDNLLKERPELFMQGESVVNWNMKYKKMTALCLSQLFMEGSRFKEFGKM